MVGVHVVASSLSRGYRCQWEGQKGSFFERHVVMVRGAEAGIRKEGGVWTDQGEGMVWEEICGPYMSGLRIYYDTRGVWGMYIGFILA